MSMPGKWMFLKIVLVALCGLMPGMLQAAPDLTGSGHSPGPADTVVVHSDQQDEELENDFSPGLFFFAFGGLIFTLICIGAGMVVAVVALLIIAWFVSAGVLSVSVLVGLHNRSFTKGFKTFVVSAVTIGGGVAGALGAWLLNLALHWCSKSTALVIGAAGGLLTGFLLGMVLFFVIGKLAAYLRGKLQRNTTR